MKQIVSLSGGKDSTAMLLMMLERGEQIDGIVFFDWGMEFPQMYEHLDKLENYIQRPIIRLYPPHSFGYYMFEYPKQKGRTKGQRGYGWAQFRYIRWCTRIKLDVIHKLVNPEDIECIGYAYHERFSRAGNKHRWKSIPRYPLLEWGVVEQEALKYCYSKGFDWGGLYKIFKRVSCWCCPLKPERELKALKDNFPDLWQRLLDMDSRSPYPHPKREIIRAMK